mmetsp:Transcript_8033/g.21280  ORF Transcript_8033/g.21280 Transcript_8033/m.21280 type:complete len:287 (-) Transcript_8033:133-993(-)
MQNHLHPGIDSSRDVKLNFAVASVCSATRTGLTRTLHDPPLTRTAAARILYHHESAIDGPDAGTPARSTAFNHCVPRSSSARARLAFDLSSVPRFLADSCRSLRERKTQGDPYVLARNFSEHVTTRSLALSASTHPEHLAKLLQDLLSVHLHSAAHTTHTTHAAHSAHSAHAAALRRIESLSHGFDALRPKLVIHATLLLVGQNLIRVPHFCKLLAVASTAVWMELLSKLIVRFLQLCGAGGSRNAQQRVIILLRRTLPLRSKPRRVHRSPLHGAKPTRRAAQPRD